MKLSVFFVIPLCFFVVACASNPSAVIYTRDQAMVVQQVKFGTILSVQQVNIEGAQSGVGAAAGAVVGGIAGSSVGDGRGSAVAAVLGSVAGGMLGSKIENSISKKSGVELSVELDDGQIISVVQEGEEAFMVGDRVRLLTRDGVARISR
jgi:outer membrane lipoprotein SlyB